MSTPKRQKKQPLADAAASPDPQLRDLIGYRIRRLNSLLTQHSKMQSSKVIGLTLAQSRILFALGMSGASRPGAIAESAGLERSHVTQATRELIEKRLISRAADPEDGRSVLLSLTARGRAALNKGIAASAERRQLLDASLTTEEWRVFDTALTKLTDVAEQLVQVSKGDEDPVD